MSELLQWDLELFQLIHSHGHIDVLDTIMPLWRDKKTWIPLYLLLTIWLVWRYRLKALWYILAVAVLIGLSDTLSSAVIKPTVARMRPCNDPGVRESVDLLTRCGPGYSFTSSHATNHFALATFFTMTIPLFRRGWRKWGWYLWAFSIAFGQVYVGVHYPLDVFCGGLLGIALGAFVAWLYQMLPSAFVFNETAA